MLAPKTLRDSDYRSLSMKHLATACWVNKGLFNVAEFCWNLKQKPVTLPSNPKWPGQSSIDHFLICTLGKCPQFALDLLHSEVHCIPPVRGKPETSLLKNWLSTSSRIVSWVIWRILEVPQVTGVPPVIIHFLTGAKRREWMGCWGLLGWLFIASGSFLKIPYLLSTRKF